MEKESIYYDESTGKWFVSEELQKKVDELLDIHKIPLSLFEVYEIIASDIPDEYERERFLMNLKLASPWCKDVGFIPKEELELRGNFQDLTTLHFSCIEGI